MHPIVIACLLAMISFILIGIALYRVMVTGDLASGLPFLVMAGSLAGTIAALRLRARRQQAFVERSDR